MKGEMGREREKGVERKRMLTSDLVIYGLRSTFNPQANSDTDIDSISPDEIPCGWLGLKHQLTNLDSTVCITQYLSTLMHGSPILSQSFSTCPGWLLADKLCLVWILSLFL